MTRGGDGFDSNIIIKTNKKFKSKQQKELLEKGIHNFQKPGFYEKIKLKLINNENHPSNRILECPYCNRIGNLVYMYRDHFDYCKENPNRKIREISNSIIICPYCNKETVNQDRHYHFSNCKENPNYNELEDVFRNNKKIFLTCEYCNNQFKGYAQYNLHKKYCENNPDKTIKDVKICPHCGYKCECAATKLFHFEYCKENPNRIIYKRKKRKKFKCKKVICPYCGKEGSGPNMNRYHFDKCKYKPLN